MNPKASATLEKAREDRRRSNFKKALSRLEEAIGKFPKELPLYTEAIDVAMEAGESLKAIQIFKKSQRELSDDGFELWTFAVEKVGVYNDAIVGRFMLEQSVKSGEFASAYSILENLTEHAAGQMLEHVKTKKQTMSAAMGAKLAASENVVSYTLGEAMLHLRLGRTAEAMDGFVRALDEDPGTFEPLEPYLADVERQHAEKGEVSYALGCSHIAGGRVSKGVEALVRAARRTPPLTAKAVEKIESLGDHPDLPPDVRELTLAELHLGQGGLRRASALLSAVLERDPGSAGRIADILRSAVERIGEDLEIHFVFVEASFMAGRRDTGLSHLKKIHRCREHKAALVEWLESKSRCEKLSVEVQLFFAETALSEGLHGKAIEIFKDLLSHGVQEQGTIRELLSRHQSVPLVQHFYTERFGASAVSKREGSCRFETYDNPGFAALKAAPSSAGASGEPETPGFEGSGWEKSGPPAGAGPFAGPAPVSTDDAETPAAGFDNRDFSLSMHAPAEPPAVEAPPADSPAPASGASPDDWAAPPALGAGLDEPPMSIREDDSDLFDYLKRDFSPAESVQPEFDGPDEAPEREPFSDPPETPRDFDSLYNAFLEGTLDRGLILGVIERAFDEDRMDEMKRLLAIEPANLGEEIGRKYQLARYYLATGRPMPALVALKSVQLGALSKEERKAFFLRIAECYRELHNYEAAHGVYLRLMSERPGDADAEGAARMNYAKYMEAAAGAAPTLEKLSNL